MFKELTEDTLESTVRSNFIVLVQYSAGWCGNCRIMKPKFKKLATQDKEAVFLFADAEKFPNSRKLAKVDNLPTFAVFKNGKLADQVQTNKFEVLKGFLGH